MPESIAHYELQEKLGSGGMGTVFKALDENTGSTVAIKVLHAHLAEDPEYIRRFAREAQIVRNLVSPHIVKVYESGNEHGLYYIVMEYVNGRALADYMAEKGPLPIPEALSIASRICLALREAHRKGIVHRDITPQNILMDTSGEVKVSDFGIARDLAEGLTTTTTFFGKPHYSSPDQWAGKVDIRSDIYSLGIVMYQMLAGVVPFASGAPLAIMRMHEDVAPPSLRSLRQDVSPGLHNLVHHCLEKKPADRFQSPDELLAALTTVQNGGDPLLSPRSRPAPHAARSEGERRGPPSRTPATSRRRGALPPAFVLWIAVGGVVLLVVSVVVGAAISSNGGSSARRSVAEPVTEHVSFVYLDWKANPPEAERILLPAPIEAGTTQWL